MKTFDKILATLFFITSSLTLILLAVEYPKLADSEGLILPSFLILGLLSSIVSITTFNFILKD